MKKNTRVSSKSVEAAAANAKRNQDAKSGEDGTNRAELVAALQSSLARKRDQGVPDSRLDRILARLKALGAPEKAVVEAHQ